MWIKICGLQRLEIAPHLGRLDVNAVGINRYEGSSRHVPPERARELAEALRGVDSPPEVVGVYVNAEVDTILGECREIEFDRVQLHGDESPQEVEAIGSEVTVMKALRVDESFSADTMERYACEVFLLDAHHPGRYGGTGETAPWGRIAPLTDRYRIVLAGGLTPDNIRRAVRTVDPWGVDVCSGVETTNGRRDVEAAASIVETLRTGRAGAGEPDSGREDPS